MSLTGKIALITGASRGIGHAIMLQLAQQGATVVGTATSEVGVAKIETALAEQGYQGKGYVLDIASSQSIDQLMSALKTDIGLPDILVNNAGITRDNLLMRMSEEEWHAVINTNLTSVYRLSKSCLRSMMKSKWGRIITIGSVVGSMGNAGQANYCAAKAGLVGFSKSLAKEIASRNITVNVVAPGFIETDMTATLPQDQKKMLLDHIPAQRMGTAEDIAAAVGFLASENAGYITGETLHVNGGMHVV